MMFEAIKFASDALASAELYKPFSDSEEPAGDAAMPGVGRVLGYQPVMQKRQPPARGGSARDALS